MKRINSDAPGRPDQQSSFVMGATLGKDEPRDGTGSISRPLVQLRRPRLPSRSLEEIYGLPPQALLIPAEAGLVTRLTESALAVRRSKGQWPPYVKFGRLVRYGLATLLTPPDQWGAP
jgi:hypothetical protein